MTKLVLAGIAAVLLFGGAGFAVARPSRRRGPRKTAPADWWGLKPLPEGSKKRAWLEDLVQRVRPIADAYGMPLSVAVAQAALETGWGGKGASNPWGLRGIGDVGSSLITTHEVRDPSKGKVKLTGQKFAKFSSLEAAAEGYMRFLQGPRYQEGAQWISADDGRWLLWVWGAGYATSTRYGQTAASISRKVAATLQDPDLAVTWSDEHQAIADALSGAKPGSQRHNLTRELLA